MNEFDFKAQDWDKNQTHIERSQAIALALLNMIPVNKRMTALEYGAGTGLLSFNLKERFSKITLMDSSQEMVRIAQGKIADARIKNIRALWIDLEKEDFSDEFDIIYNQMVLHHVKNIELIFDKFHAMLKPNGYMAIADLYTEDGSFHGEGFSGHKGFDLEKLSNTLKEHSFKNIKHQQCFVIRKPYEYGIKEYPVFLMVASRL